MLKNTRKRLFDKSNNLIVSSVDARANTLSLRFPITLGPSLVFELVEFGALGSLSPQDVASEPPRQHLCELVLGMCSSRHSEDVIQFFQSPLLGLIQEQEDHPESNEVHRGIETECALNTKGFQLTWERDWYHSSPEVVGGYSPWHTNLTMRKREHFCRVCEGNWSFSRRVEGVVDVNEESDQSKMGTTARRNPVAHASQKKTPAHVWKREQEQTSASIGIDSPDCRPCEEKVHSTKPEGSQKSADIGCSSLNEDGGWIEGDNVDYSLVRKSWSRERDIKLTSAHLLSNHDHTRCLSSTAETRNREQFEETSEKVVRLRKPTLFQE